MELERIIASKVKEIIKKSGYKQYIIAEKCGYSGKQFSDLLTGRKIIRADDILNICKGLEISPNKLFDYESDE